MAQPKRFPKLYDEEWLREQYLGKKLSDREIAEPLGCTFSAVRAVRQRFDITDSRPHFHRRDTMTRWKSNKWGYIFVYMPSHPDAKKGSIQEHRLVMEASIGRRLKPKEFVHHINGIKDDNRLENLQIVGAGNHQYEEPAWKLFWWAKDNPAEAKEFLDKIEASCAPSETKRLDSTKVEMR